MLVDLAGHGESGLGRETWTIPAYGRDVVAVADTLGLDGMILIGHSMGGPVVLEAARMMPDRVIAVVGVDTFNDFEVEFNELQMMSFLKPLEEDFTMATGAFVQSLFTPNSDTALVREVINDMSSAPPEVGIGSLKAYLDLDQAKLIDQVKVPIRGINSARYPVKVETNKKHAVSYEVVFMEDVGHFPHLEDPETFNSHLTEIIKELMAEEASEDEVEKEEMKEAAETGGEQ